MKHSHYKRDISNLNLKVLDVYRLIDLFNITCPVAQHIFKKSMAAGQRGHKDLRKDWQDILDSAERRLEMLDEDAVQSGIGDFGHQHMIEPKTPTACRNCGDRKGGCPHCVIQAVEPASLMNEERADIVASSHGDGEHYAYQCAICGLQMQTDKEVMRHVCGA